MNKNKISVTGCGWFGLPLAEHLVAKNYEVKGSVTSLVKLSLLAGKGIDPYLMIINPDVRSENIDQLLDVDTLVINIPPKGGRENLVEFHKNQIQSLINFVNDSPVENVVFISSTSVYGNNNDTVTEETKLEPASESGKALVEVEKIIRENENFESTIVRFGGLIGPGRNPAKFMAGKDNIPGGENPVNLIHLDDCIRIIERIMVENIWNETFNACADEHPPKREVYAKAANKAGLKLPVFQERYSSYKIVNSDKLKRKLNYSFKYPNPLNMF